MSFSACGIFGPSKGPRKTIPDINIPDQNDQNDNVGKVDTIELLDITKVSTPPISENTKVTKVSEKKSVYNIAMLFPFNAIRYQNISSQVDPKGKRFIQYYAGARIAIDDLMSEGKRVDIRTFDTEESESKVRSLLNDVGVLNADLIIGPYRPDNIQIVSEFAKEKQIPCASPWIPSFELEENNPFFIQMTPGLTAHAEAIFKQIKASFVNQKVYIVGRNRGTEMSRLELFKNAFNKFSNREDKLNEIIIEDNTSDLQNTDILHILEEPGRAVFVVPYYSRGDEAFINSILRKLHAEKLTKEVTVFGMPQWLNFRELSYDYLESLDVHISTISFSDSYHHKYSSFKSRFYDRYGIVPDQSAFQGYDLMYYFGTLLHAKGTGFLNDLEMHITNPINLGVDIEPVYENDAMDRDPDSTPKYYENKGIQILRFQNLEFKKIN